MIPCAWAKASASATSRVMWRAAASGSFRSRTSRFRPARYNFLVDSGGPVRSSPYLRLAAYYALLGLAAWLVIRFLPGIPELLDRVRQMSLLGAVASRGRLVDEATQAVATLSQGQWGLVTLLSMVAAVLLVLPVSWG